MTGAPASTSGPTGYTGTVAHVFDVSNNMPWFLNPVNTFGGSTGATPSWVAGNGQVLIQKVVLAGATGTVTFSAIPQVFNHLRLVCMGELNQASADNFGVRIGVGGGAILTTGYDWQYTTSANITASGGQGLSSIIWPAARISGNVNASPGCCDIQFPCYSLGTFNKSYIAYGGAVPQVTGESNIVSGSCRSTTSPITSIAITSYTTPGTIAYLSGSAFYLYGVW